MSEHNIGRGTTFDKLWFSSNTVDLLEYGKYVEDKDGYDLEYLIQGKPCLSISMQEFKLKFGEFSRRERRK